MSCCDKKDPCGYPIEPAPFAPGGCDPHPPCPPRPPRPPYKPGCPPSQYIGSRYVPIFADPIEWDKSKAYESLTIVTYQGESYTSKCNVGPSIDITNTTYWAKTGAYNAQVEQYKSAVDDLSSQVTGFASDNARFREQMEGFTKDNTEVKETVATYTEKVDKLAERMTTAETDIGDLQATTAQHTKDIADLTAKDADLQAQITSNDTDISALQDHSTEQDSRLDGVESVNTSQNTKIAQNAADIAAEVTRASNAEIANGKLIAANAEELAKHATKLADHERRITALETDNVTNKADIRANTAKNVEQDTSIAAAKDAAAHAQETADVAEGKADANSTTIGSWEAAHPNKTIAQAVTDANTDIASNTTKITNLQNGLSSTNETVTNLQNTKANKTDLDSYVTTTTYTTGQKTQDDRITALENMDAGITYLPWTVWTGIEQQIPGFTRLSGVIDTGTLEQNSGTIVARVRGFIPVVDGTYTLNTGATRVLALMTSGSTVAKNSVTSQHSNTPLTLRVTNGTYVATISVPLTTDSIANCLELSYYIKTDGDSSHA